MDTTAKVVDALMRYGPRYSKISRETGVPIPTVRYILTKRLPKMGFNIKAILDYGALGLQKYLALFESSVSPNSMRGLLTLLGETMYLNYYAYFMKAKRFMAIFTAPLKYEEDLDAFLNELSSVGVFKRYELKKLKYARTLPFRARYFDFNKGVWRQNWTEDNEPIPEIFDEVNPHPEIDEVDLHILKELQKNAYIKYVDLSRKLGLSRQTIKRHYERVAKMIRMYAIFWFPPMNPELILTPMMMKFSDVERSRNRAVGIPFNYMELRTNDDDYYILTLLPSIELYRTIKYLAARTSLEEIFFLDMDYSMGFTVHYNLFKRKVGWINPFREGCKKIVEEIGLLFRA